MKEFNTDKTKKIKIKGSIKELPGKAYKTQHKMAYKKIEKTNRLSINLKLRFAFKVSNFNISRYGYSIIETSSESHLTTFEQYLFHHCLIPKYNIKTNKQHKIKTILKTLVLTYYIQNGQENISKHSNLPE